ncbi:MAG: type II secretion system F family protein [Candidatus Aenigmatarchaeota archaeon]
MLSYSTIAVYLFGSLVDSLASNFIFLKDKLSPADIKIPFRTYLSIMFLITIFFISVTNPLRYLFIFTVPILLPILSILIFAYYPSYRANSRKRSIETNLPFVLSHMSSIAQSGIPPYMIFRLLIKFEEYGEISKEMQKIVRNIDVFGIDPLTAFKEAAKRTPSKDFKEILLGIVTTTESGGNIKTYLKNAGERALFNWRVKREKYMQQLSTYAEFYTGILIAAPLFIISLFSVMNMIQPELAGYNIVDLTRLSIYILIPFINIVFLLFLRGVEVEM